MGIFSTDKNQITLIYNSNTSIGKQTYAYVSDSKKKIRSINTAKNSLTSTQWVEIAEKLDIKIKQLINKKHPDYKSLYADNISLKRHDWLKIVEKYSHLVSVFNFSSW